MMVLRCYYFLLFVFTFELLSTSRLSVYSTRSISQPGPIVTRLPLTDLAVVFSSEIVSPLISPASRRRSPSPPETLTLAEPPEILTLPIITLLLTEPPRPPAPPRPPDMETETD